MGPVDGWGMTYALFRIPVFFSFVVTYGNLAPEHLPALLDWLWIADSFAVAEDSLNGKHHEVF